MNTAGCTRGILLGWPVESGFLDCLVKNLSIPQLIAPFLFPKEFSFLT